MVTRCCACKEVSKAGGPVTFHKFPKDPNRRKQWTANLNKGDYKVTDYTSICSKHFTPESFETHKFGGTWLKKDAVPTLFGEDLNKNGQTKSKPCTNGAINKTEVSEVFENVPSPSRERQKRRAFLGDFDITDMECPTNARIVFAIAKKNHQSQTSKIRQLYKKNRRLQKKVSSLKNKLELMKRKMFLSKLESNILKVKFPESETSEEESEEESPIESGDEILIENTELDAALEYPGLDSKLGSPELDV